MHNRTGISDPLYQLLEGLKGAGIPTAWVARARKHAPTKRVVIPPSAPSASTLQITIFAAKTYRPRSENGGTPGIQIVNWRRALARG
jgi:hypothetical protein